MFKHLCILGTGRQILRAHILCSTQNRQKKYLHSTNQMMFLLWEKNTPHPRNKFTSLPCCERPLSSNCPNLFLSAVLRLMIGHSKCAKFGPSQDLPLGFVYRAKLTPSDPQQISFFSMFTTAASSCCLLLSTSSLLIFIALTEPFFRWCLVFLCLLICECVSKSINQ